MKNTYREQIKFYIFSYDFIFSLLIFVISLLVFPSWLNIELFLIPVYNMLLTITGILTAGIFTIFSVVFSTSTDDFILFLEKDEIFTKLISSFKIILKIIIITLLLDMFIYVFTIHVMKEYELQHKIIFCFLITLFSYSILSTYSAIMCLLEYLKRRVEYMKILSNKEK